MTGKKMATRDAYGKALIELGEKNEDIVVLDADLSKSTRTEFFAKQFPERFFNVGIAEQNLMGTAAGLAASGKIPFASTFAVFATGRAYDQIRNTIAYPHLNVKIAASHAGITVGEDGASHQTFEDISLMRNLPGMTVICPADPVEAKHAVFKAAEIKGPVYIRLGRPKVPYVFDDDTYSFEPGKGIMVKDGSDLTIFATGIMVSQALDAARILEGKGLKARVVNIHTIKPIDKELIVRCAKQTGAIVTAEEHSIIGGLGSAVAEVVSENYPVPVKRVGIKDDFGMSGSADELLVKYNLTPEDIVDAALTSIKIKDA